MGGGRETLALVVGEGGSPADGASAARVLGRAVSEVLVFESPADALDSLREMAGSLPPRGRTLIVIDGRGAEDARLTWVPLLVGLDLGPVILLADDDRTDVVHAAKLHGVSRCLEHRHLSRHPGLLARSARRALAAEVRAQRT
jgi:hypothetical protein